MTIWCILGFHKWSDFNAGCSTTKIGFVIDVVGNKDISDPITTKEKYDQSYRC